MDPFVVLADRLMGRMRETAKEVSNRHERFVVEEVDPLELRSEDGTLTLSEEDDDVEVFRTVEKAITAGELAVGDVVDARETRDGWEIVGIVA